ncbi:hypothetical protein FM111_12345 [Brevundimonas diminuta 3F5N]|uniref:Transporter n=1 Tax=Brevundimonas diminuta 3F5N TaxID=1255603 RepID=A0A1R4GFQ8_BREDI|nr:FtsX-like permease family protein [Brevundimonas diminuta]SJM66905.1 hypothetical protein FM111_12345 [Brevundimonas diminuta 3F5N]
MNRFALVSLYRSLIRHPLYTAVNVGGLAMGIAVFILLGLYVRFETSFETWLPEHQSIYQVQSEWNLPGSPFNGVMQNTPGGLLDMMQEDFPELKGTRILTSGKIIHNGVAMSENIAHVDPDFLDIFRLEMVRGDARTAMRDPANLVLSETAASRYFGSADPIGRTLTLSDGENADLRKVVGVFRDLPANTDFNFTAVTPMKPPAPDDMKMWRNLGALSVSTYLRFDTPGQARAFIDKLPAFVERHGADLGEKPAETLRYPLTPIADLRLASGDKGSDNRRLTIAMLGLVGLLALVIAIVNYVNLAVARAGLRAREVAMRKVVGASRGALIQQFLGEAIVLVALAALVGLILAELGLPLINAAADLSLTLPYGVVLPVLALLIVVIGAVAGFYPAVLLSRYPAALVLASARSPGGGRAGARVREALVVLQFTLATGFIIAAGVLFAQMQHVRSVDLGFQREGLLIVPAMTDSSLTESQRLALLAALRDVRGVTHVTTATLAAGGSNSHAAENMPVPGTPGDGPTLRKISVGPDFFATYGMTPVAGRVFDPNYRSDDSTETERAGGFNIVINRKAAEALGFALPQDAIGKTVGGHRARTIVGVVEDARFFSPRTPIDPAVYVYKARIPDWPMVTMRYQGDPRQVMEQTRTVWRRIAPSAPFNGAHADRRLTELYAADDRAARLFGMGAGLAILIGCVGLWGLASFSTQQRVKEIGIRKTLGASSSDIVKLLVAQFLRPVLIANLFAWPLAFFAARTWLAGFDDRIALSPLYFIGASVVAVLIAVLTVLSQSIRASRAAPAWALRHD